jgi:excisionase family DNA binding protein
MTNKTEKKSKLMTTKEAAEIWNIPRKSIYRLVRNGKLRPYTGFKSWMFLEDDLYKNLERL